VDFSSLISKLQSGEFMDPDQIEDFLVTQYGSLMAILTCAFTLPFAVWWVWRCWRGFALARREKPVENVKTWL
jgi:hypothetical protein